MAHDWLVCSVSTGIWHLTQTVDRNTDGGQNLLTEWALLLSYLLSLLALQASLGFPFCDHSEKTGIQCNKRQTADYPKHQEYLSEDQVTTCQHVGDRLNTWQPEGSDDFQSQLEL